MNLKEIGTDIVARLTAANLGVMPKRSRFIPTTDAKLPALQVFARQKAGQADGNAGNPSFRGSLSIGIIYRDTDKEPQDLEDRVIDMADAIVKTLLTDPDFVAQFENITATDQVFAEVTGGARHIMDAQIELVAQFYQDFEPVIPDDFEGVDAVYEPTAEPGTTGVPVGGEDVGLSIKIDVNPEG